MVHLALFKVVYLTEGKVYSFRKSPKNLKASLTCSIYNVVQVSVNHNDSIYVMFCELGLFQGKVWGKVPNKHLLVFETSLENQK